MRKKLEGSSHLLKEEHILSNIDLLDDNDDKEGSCETWLNSIDGEDCSILVTQHLFNPLYTEFFFSRSPLEVIDKLYDPYFYFCDMYELALETSACSSMTSATPIH